MQIYIQIEFERVLGEFALTECVLKQFRASKGVSGLFNYSKAVRFSSPVIESTIIRLCIRPQGEVPHLPVQ